MRKLVLALGALFALSLFSCNGTADNSAVNEDTTAVEDTVIDSLVEVSGVAIDGAMNSVYLKVGDDTVEFSYPDLDSDHRASWAINDSMTVRYYKTENGDSIVDVINNTDA